MKKILFSALAAMSLVACVQEQVMDVPTGGAITFENAFVDNATRANVIDKDNLEAFKVWGFVNAPSGVVFDNTLVSKNGTVWAYDGTQYWAPDQNYYFAAVAPVSELWSLNTSDADVTGPGVLSFTNDAATDLIYAEKHVQAAAAGQTNDAVAFQFQHLLSKVKLTFSNGFPIETVKVTNIKMATPKSADIDLTEAHAWSSFGENMTLNFDGKKLANSETKTTVEEYFIIPAVATISFDLTVVVGDQTVYTGSKTATLPADAFEMGHAYNLSAMINPASLDFDEIVFTVDEVVDWTETPNASDKAANLIYAAQIGGEVTLEENVVLDAPVVVPAGVEFVLNLNGKSIKNTTQSEVFGEGEGIIAYGDLTINGEGTVEGTTMAVWARGNDGAKVTINGGTYKGCAEGFAKGGRSVIYASSGNTIDIYGGTFEALAADKTSYANKTEGVKAAINIADNNGYINIYGGTFVGQNPAAPGTEPKAWNAAHPNGFVAEGHVVNKDGDNYKVIPFGTNVTLTEDLTLASVLVITEDTVIDLNGKILKGGKEDSPEMTGTDIAAITVNGANLTIAGEGSIEGTEYGVYVKNGSVTIEEATIKAGTSAVQVYNGTANIEGGKFSATKSDVYVVNCIDANWKNGTAKVNITGGEFVNFNPANNAAEGNGTNFVAPGYASNKIEGTDNYEVVVDMTTNTADLKTELREGTKTCIYLKPGTTFEGTFSLNRNVKIVSDENNMATIAGRINVKSAASFENVKFAGTDDSKVVWTTGGSNMKLKPAILMVETNEGEISFNNCDFNIISGVSALTTTTSGMPVFKNCKFYGDYNYAVYARANIEVSECVFSTTKTNVLAATCLNSLNNGKVVFVDNTLLNGSNIGLSAAVVFTSTNNVGGKWPGPVEFTVKNNDGFGYTYERMNNFIVDPNDHVFTEGSEVMNF